MAGQAKKPNGLPARPGSERYIITCCLNSPDVIIDIGDKLKPEDFYTELYKYAFQVCLRMVEKEMVPEPMTVYNMLETLGVAKPENLRELELLAKASHDTRNIQNSIDDIKAASVRRQLIRASQESIEKLNVEDMEPQEALSLCEENILNVSSKMANSTEVYKVGSDTAAILEARIKNPVKVPGLPTGFPRFDEELQGLQPGRLYILAARYKVGKSIFLLNVADYVSRVAGVPVLFIDTENSSHQVDDRFVSLVSGVEEVAIRNGMFSKVNGATDKVMRAVEELKGAEIYHHYMPTFTFDACLSLIRRYKAQKNIGLVIFDYIKTPDDVRFGQHMREDQSLGYLTSNFHNKVAGALQLPVLSACQLGRRAVDADEESDDHIADSDRIGRYADVVMFLREKSSEEKAIYGFNRHSGNMVLTTMINRAGPSRQNAYDLFFDKPVMKIQEVRVRPI